MPLASSNLTLTLRPSSFEEVIGLETAIRTIKNTIDEGTIPRGFIIQGPYGCGKTTLAWIIAKYVQGPFFEGDPQVQEVNGANYRKIDDMRRLCDSAGSYPMVGTYAVIILDECQQLTADAQQVLLKELEVKSSPTIWIFPTTDPQKLNEGVRDRCFPVSVEGMDAAKRHELIDRCAKALSHTGDTTEFEAAITRAHLVSPRKIVMAFDAFHNGTPAVQAVGAMHYENLPVLFDIANGVIHGNWTKAYNIRWMNNKGFDSVVDQLKKLEASLKKKPIKEAVETPATDDEQQIADSTVEDDDLVAGGKAAAAQTLRIITASLLRNKVFKGGEEARQAAIAMSFLASALGEAPYGMEWQLTIGSLYRVYQALRQSKS